MINLDIEQGDLITLLELAKEASKDESILLHLDISDEYAKELENTATKLQEQLGA